MVFIRSNLKAIMQILGALMLLTVADLTFPQQRVYAAWQDKPVAKDDDTKVWTLNGVCQDENGKPLSGVQATLYRQDLSETEGERLRTEITKENGLFRFAELAPPPSELRTWIYVVSFTKQGRGSSIHPFFAEVKEPYQVKVPPAATLQGRVTDLTGNPVVGADVWSHSYGSGPLKGVCSTRTDADGRYGITDMCAWGPDALKPREIGKGLRQVLAGCYFDVRHPDFGHERPMYSSMPATVDVVLKPGGKIEGRVIDQVTGKRAPGERVCMQSTNQGGPDGGGWQQVRTDSEGKYRFSSVRVGTYNLWSDASERTCAALDSFAVTTGKTNQAPDLVLISGGWIEGQVVDAATGKPLIGTKERPLRVATYGPSRPKSGAACQAVVVDDKGGFRLRVAPGVNYPYIMASDLWQRTERMEQIKLGIEVKSAEVVSMIFRVAPAKP